MSQQECLVTLYLQKRRRCRQQHHSCIRGRKIEGGNSNQVSGFAELKICPFKLDDLAMYMYVANNEPDQV